MGKKAARQKDKLDGISILTVKLIFPPQAPPFPAPFQFRGQLQSALAFNVRVQGKNAAKVLSVAQNKPKHKPLPGTRFLVPPTNQGFVAFGSKKVRINKLGAAREGDKGFTDSQIPLPVAKVKIVGKRTVKMG